MSSPQTQRFCKDCGTALDGARFCPACGAATENARPQDERSQPAPAGPATRRRWLIAGGIGAVVLVLALVAVLVLVRRSPSTAVSYPAQVRAALGPVVQQNRQLSDTFGALSLRSGPGPVKSSVRQTIGTTRAAQSTLRTLSPAAGDRFLAVTAGAALSSELAWLNAASAVLANPGSPMLGQLGSLGADTQAKLAAIDAQVPGASASFPGSARLISYATARGRAASTDAALRQFDGQVQSLLTQSSPAYRQVNELFRQMQTAAAGGTPTISLVQAETILTTVISNRTALAASARTLSAPTPLAASVRAALVTAFDASLTNDQAIAGCLHQANTGTVAFIFGSCLNSTAASSSAATNAKQAFLSAYDELRRQIGLPASSTQF